MTARLFCEGSKRQTNSAGIKREQGRANGAGSHYTGQRERQFGIALKANNCKTYSIIGHL